jgi:hypothetical protein
VSRFTVSGRMSAKAQAVMEERLIAALLTDLA